MALYPLYHASYPMKLNTYFNNNKKIYTDVIQSQKQEFFEAYRLQP